VKPAICTIHIVVLIKSYASHLEIISIVNIEDVYKVVVNLCCYVIFPNFDGLKVVTLYPLYLEYIDVRKEQPTENYKIDPLKKLY
jgi:hypothetical protein